MDRNAIIEIESLKLYYVLFTCGVNKLERGLKISDLLQKYINPWMENRVTIFGVGSMAEGVTQNNSDIDFMIIWNSFICYDDGENIESANNSQVVIRADRTTSPPGYTQGQIIWPLIEDMKKLKNKLLCIPNLLNTIYINRNGPATRLNSPPISSEHLYRNKDDIQQFFKNLLKDTEYNEQDIVNEFKKLVRVELDFVIGVPFVSTKIMQSWENRKRTHGWPSQELIAELKQHGGHIVPVGLRGSSTEDADWRISYAVIETNLIKSFNEVQLMTYKILKRIISDIPSCTDLTSYHIKNLMLWLAESIDNKYFYPANLMKLVYVSLTILCKRVEKRKLPNYMMPERNLFQNKLLDHHKILEILKDMLTTDTLANTWYESSYRHFFNSCCRKNVHTIGAEIITFVCMINHLQESSYETFISKFITIANVFLMYHLITPTLIIRCMNCYSLKIVDPEWKCLLDAFRKHLQTKSRNEVNEISGTD